MIKKSFLFIFVIFRLQASYWTNFDDYQSNPILPPDLGYYPCILYNSDQFSGHGNNSYYKAWYSFVDGSNRYIYYIESNDSLNWTSNQIINAPAPLQQGGQYQPVVIYDQNAFHESGGYYYKMWCWSGSVTPPVNPPNATTHIFAKSKNGIDWEDVQYCTQNTEKYLVNPLGSWFYHLYGPGYIFYNPNATNSSNDPLSFRYVMYFDVASKSPNYEHIGLAYSSDGLFWNRFGNVPVLSASEAWEANNVYRCSVLNFNNIYHMWYSGSNRGIGHAVSNDGINWEKDPDNPAISRDDANVPTWRDTRTYTPWVIFDRARFSSDTGTDLPALKIFYTGATVIGTTQYKLGLATIYDFADVVNITKINEKNIFSENNFVKLNWDIKSLLPIQIYLYKIYKRINNSWIYVGETKQNTFFLENAQVKIDSYLDKNKKMMP